MRLALGTAQFGMPYGLANRLGVIVPEAARQIVTEASTAGIDLLDTAVAYGDSQAALGRIGVSGWKIVTKMPALPEACADVRGWVSACVADSLRLLGVSRLYGLLLHRPHDLLDGNGLALINALERLKGDGIIENTGVSIYAPDILGALPASMPLDIVQTPFNVLDRRIHQSGWLQRLADTGTEVHVRSVFLQGLLLMDKAERSEYFAEWDSLWMRWNAWLQENAVDALTACLGFVHAFPEVQRVVVGVDSVEHFRGLLRASNLKAPAPPVDMCSTNLRLIDPSRWRRE